MDTPLSGGQTVPQANRQAHPHDWQPIAGWTARYRCRTCYAVGYKPRVVTAHLDDGPFGTTRTIPYVCGVLCAGTRCGRPAVTKRSGKWRCTSHLRQLRARTCDACTQDGTRTAVRAPTVVSTFANQEGGQP